MWVTCRVYSAFMVNETLRQVKEDERVMMGVLRGGEELVERPQRFGSFPQQFRQKRKYQFVI